MLEPISFLTHHRFRPGDRDRQRLAEDGYVENHTSANTDPVFVEREGILVVGKVSEVGKYDTSQGIFEQRPGVFERTPVSNRSSDFTIIFSRSGTTVIKTAQASWTTEVVPFENWDEIGISKWFDPGKAGSEREDVSQVFPVLMEGLEETGSYIEFVQV